MELYVHIPFCKSKCRYCDFPSFAGCSDFMPAYIDTLLLQAANYSHTDFARQTIRTVYIGGGTPSLLSPDLLTKLLNGLRHTFDIDQHAEISSESNPGTITTQWAEAAASCGINRISMGVQAVQDSLLQMLGRIHRWPDVIKSYKIIRSSGIRNINLDLMFGLPGQTTADWLESLQHVLSLNPEHLSCYGLIPEDGTPLFHDLDTGSLELPPVDIEREMYDDCLNLLHNSGYIQYEISNFAKPGFSCQHNIGYWRQQPYIGLGSSAASYLPDGKGFMARISNPADISQYMKMECSHDDCRERQIITPRDAMFETLMLGLRMNDGVSETEFYAMHGISLDEYKGGILRKLQAQELLKCDDHYWKLTRRGMDIQNAILVELMDD